jgi:hypothetical protein
MCSYDSAIYEAEIAKDWLWLAGALSGKASALVIQKKTENPAFLEFDSGVVELMTRAHGEYTKTKMTNLEVEHSLIFAKYLANFAK